MARTKLIIYLRRFMVFVFNFGWFLTILYGMICTLRVLLIMPLLFGAKLKFPSIFTTTLLHPYILKVILIQNNLKCFIQFLKFPLFLIIHLPQFFHFKLNRFFLHKRIIITLLWLIWLFQPIYHLLL